MSRPLIHRRAVSRSLGAGLAPDARVGDGVLTTRSAGERFRAIPMRFDADGGASLRLGDDEPVSLMPSADFQPVDLRVQRPWETIWQ